MATSTDTPHKSVTEETDPLDDWERQVAEAVINPLPYNRLMVAYRKQKRYADELRVINRALSVFGERVNAIQDGLLHGHRKRSQIKALSTRISKQMGLADSKGKALQRPEPLNRWEKRKAAVEKKMAATASPGKRPLKKAGLQKAGKSGGPFSVLARPAQRALADAGIHSLAQLRRWTAADLQKLHGLGPKAIELLRRLRRGAGAR